MCGTNYHYIKLSYLCSISYKERINIAIWRDTSCISLDENLGSINGTGGLTQTYTLNIIDRLYNQNLDSHKYYIKYKLEDNIYGNREPMGIVNINTLDTGVNGSSVIILSEI